MFKVGQERYVFLNYYMNNSFRCRLRLTVRPRVYSNYSTKIDSFSIARLTGISDSNSKPGFGIRSKFLPRASSVKYPLLETWISR